MRPSRRGWTSISEQWVNPERLHELDGPRRRRRPAASRRRLPRAERSTRSSSATGTPTASRARWMTASASRALKIHLDNGWGTTINWEPDDLTATIGRANEAGWQVSVHSVSTEAQELVLDAFEAALGPAGPNPLHHRIEHAIQVTDEQLARMVAMDLAHRDPPRRGRSRLGAVRRTTWPTSAATTRRGDRRGSPAGATSSMPGCTSPRQRTRRGSSRRLRS